MRVTVSTHHPAEVTHAGIPSPPKELGRVDVTDDAPLERPPWPLPLLIYGAIVIVLAADLWTDASGSASRLHIALEAVGMGLALLGLVAVAWRVGMVRRSVRRLNVALVRARADASRWRSEAEESLKGLSAAIDHQFDAWALSVAEREIALLLLKGLSLREIADVRGTSERTVRQQALAIYKKADVAGRAELSAFFLEDLLAPPVRAKPDARA